MTACVFLGPTLPVAQARKVLDAEYLPPVRQGDVYRAVSRYRPRAVGIVDGYFHQVPSVWHKEILWAMAEGVHVFGSSSMGALRAAELHPFGMRGVGRVFSAFVERTIEDDDEVAVVHGPPETGFLAASEAMVNIRRTLAEAKAGGVIGEQTRHTLEAIAKSLFYPRRSYPELLQRGAGLGLPARELSAFGQWVDRNRVDVKREDALEMLAAMGELIAADTPPKRVDYSFEHTTMWQAAVDRIHSVVDDAAAGPTHSDQEWLLDELRLDVDAYRRLERAALLSLLARREVERGGIDVDDQELSRFTTQFRLEQGLHFARDLDRWLSERGLDRESFRNFMRDELLLSRLAREQRPKLLQGLIDQLRVEGRYEETAKRAETKRNCLQDAGDYQQIDQMHGERDAIEHLRAVTWYFTQHLGRPVPENIDIWAERAGFESVAALRRALLREYRFQLEAKKA